MIRALLLSLRARIAAPIVAAQTRTILSERNRLQAELDTLRVEREVVARVRVEVPEARVLDVLHVVNGATFSLTAFEIAAWLDNEAYPSFAGMKRESIARTVSAVAAEGYLLADGKRPLRYSLSAQGSAALGRRAS